MKALGREGGRNMGFGLLTQMKTNYMHFWTTQHSHFFVLGIYCLPLWKRMTKGQ